MNDYVSDYLFKAWYHSSVDGKLENQYFFPNFGLKDGKLYWNSPLSGPAHKRACQACAAFLKLPITSDDLDTYASNCVRRGLAAEVVQQVRDFLQQTNPSHGRAAGSKMDLNPYCPKEVILMPGPLFSDTQGIKDRAMDFLGAAMLASAATLLCRACGYPQCSCTRCEERAKQLDGKWSASAKATTAHSCWLAKNLKGRIPKSGPKEDEGQQALRQKSWEKFGMGTPPAWAYAKVGGRDCSCYKFP